MLLLIIFGDNGLVDFVLIKGEKDRLVEKNEKLNQENLNMYREIDRLKNDPKFVENVVRQELGVIGKDEVIFKTGKNQGNKK
jgi:cell division protein FtsB